MNRKSVKVNAVLNVIKSLLSVIFPLITYPYATRVLGVESLGKVNYGASIITYFSLIAAFGITTYAIREGAKIRDSKDKINKLSSEIFSINIGTTLVSYILLFLLLVFTHKFDNYRLLILLQSITIIFTTLGVDWINTIYEDYFYITVRGIITNIISLIALFLFVKDMDDYYIYALLTVLTNAVVCILNFIYCKKYVHFKFTLKMNIKLHVRKMFVFFINAVAVSIYVSADTTMLGWMVGDYSVGLYSVAVKIYSIMKVMLAAIYVVALPRLSYYISQKNFSGYENLITNVISTITLLLLPATMGLFALSKQVVWVIGGEGFLEATRTLQILSISLLFAIFGGIISQCINISLGLERISAKATVISAVLNIVLNIFFIKWLQENGAAITTAISEFMVLLYCIIKSKKSFMEFINLKKVIINFIHAFIGVCIVLFTIITINFLSNNIWIIIIASISISMALYGAFLIIAKNEVAIDIMQRISIRRKV